MNWELPDVQAGFRKGRGTRDQVANLHWIIEKAREFQKNIYFSLIDYTKASDCVDHKKLWKILKEMGIPDTLLASWETCMQVNKQQLELDKEQWTDLKLGQEFVKAVYCYIYAEYSMQNAGLEEVQGGIKISRRNINNLRYADDITLMTEGE